ncbi:energy transducer TonB [Flavobacterium cerinum]|uniref:TonB C-terminal domain-containing protein n=1 Tax=Flavobacterium cerinum TaxID=2502784 RepID=A0A3S3U1V9_9FLAO|nr:hypothetical protein [Flavobacterium cerinum]RWX02222.1 hypothetical protein EPI11_03120 [Flavobacterium cerinum]
MKFIIILFSLFFLNSCNQKTELEKFDKNGKPIVYSEEVYMKMWFKNRNPDVTVIDTFCINQKTKAVNDIKNGKLTYTLINGYGMYDYSDKEMTELLLKKSIVLNSVLKPCMGPRKGFNWYCYAELMNSEIEKKFGEKFIDSLRNIADKQFIEKNPGHVFSFHECDTTSRYSNAKSYEEYLTKPKDDFMNGLDYPGMNKVKKERVNTEVFFVIYRDGTIGNIKAKSDFSKAKNKIFAKYFESKALDFVKKSKWKPAKYRGINVNSEMYLNLYN